MREYASPVGLRLPTCSSKPFSSQANVAAADLPSGVKYVVRLYDPSGALVATRTMSDKLGAKEFDEEDFHVTP